MKKKLVLVNLLLIAVLIIAGCSSAGSGDGEDGGITDWLSIDVYIKVVDNSGDPIKVDSITLLDKDTGEVVDYQRNTKAAQFTGIDSGEYIMVAGEENVGFAKKSYKMLKDKNIELQLDESVNQDEINMGTTPDSVNLTVLKGTSEYKTRSITGGSTSVSVWPGVIYNYQFSADGYSTYSKAYVSLNQDSSLSVVLNDTNDSRVAKYIFDTKEAKELSLGTLTSNEYAVVAVSPLNLDSTDNTSYDTSLQVEYDTSTQANMISIPPQKKDQSVSSLQLQSSGGSQPVNQPQQEVDRKMRSLGQELLQSEPQSKLNLNQTQGITQNYYNLEDTETFEVANVNSSGYSQVQATLKASNEDAYIFIADELLPDQELVGQADKLAAEFRGTNGILETDMDIFADSSFNYDWDGNGRKIILITDLGKGSGEGVIMGFFNPVDYGAYATRDGSNNADMFYINYWALEYAQPSKENQNINIDLESVYGTLAHELQHLIFFVNKYKAHVNEDSPWVEDTWINEGFSGLAEHLNGYYNYTDGGHIYNSNGTGYFNNPARESLLYWNQKLSDYGASNLFALYLYDRYGNGIIDDVNSSVQDPIEIISQRDDFSDVFLEWMVTNYSQLNAPYDYPVSLSSSPVLKGINSSGKYNFTINNTGVKYYQINGDGSAVNLQLNLKQRAGVTVFKP